MSKFLLVYTMSKPKDDAAASTLVSARLDAEGNTRATSMSAPDRPARGHEYLDHTADVQLHAWGRNLAQALEQAVLAMFGYMTDLDSVEECSTHRSEARGHDLQSALFAFLDEWLFSFSAEPNFVPFKVDVQYLKRPGKVPEVGEREDGEGEESEEEFVIKSLGIGETFDLEKHPQGTEVKAITYSAMQINETEEYAEIFVIVDI